MVTGILVAHLRAASPVRSVHRLRIVGVPLRDHTLKDRQKALECNFFIVGRRTHEDNRNVAALGGRGKFEGGGSLIFVSPRPIKRPPNRAPQRRVPSLLLLDACCVWLLLPKGSREREHLNARRETLCSRLGDCIWGVVGRLGLTRRSRGRLGGQERI